MPKSNRYNLQGRSFLHESTRWWQSEIWDFEKSHVEDTLGMNSIKTRLSPKSIPRVKMICQKIVEVFCSFRDFNSRIFHPIWKGTVKWDAKHQGCTKPYQPQLVRDWIVNICRIHDTSRFPSDSLVFSQGLAWQRQSRLIFYSTAI